MKTIFSSHIYWLNYHRYKYSYTLFTGQNRGEQTCFSSASKTQSCDKNVHTIHCAASSCGLRGQGKHDPAVPGWGVGWLSSRNWWVKLQDLVSEGAEDSNAAGHVQECPTDCSWAAALENRNILTEIRTSMLGDKVQERLTGSVQHFRTYPALQGITELKVKKNKKHYLFLLMSCQKHDHFFCGAAILQTDFFTAKLFLSFT